MITDFVPITKLGSVKVPKLHGHIKLTLTNAYSDNIEKVYEGDNLVTNAVEDIITHNYFNGVDLSLMTPTWQKWYGGILCYEQAHDSLNANNYYPKSSSVNAVTAHAGQTVYTGADDMSRGSPLTDSQSLVFTETSVKQTWEWGTTQGNGYIRALSLTHADTGDAGLGSTSSAFQAFSPYERVDNLAGINSDMTVNGVVAQYDDRHGINYLVGDDGEYTPSHYNFQTSKITVYVRPLGYNAIGIQDKSVVDNTWTRKFTVTTSINFYTMPAFYFDSATKKLWLFTNMLGTTVTNFSKNTIYYTVIDCENETEDSYGTIVSDASDLGVICAGGSYDSRTYPRVSNILKDGDYFCFPTGTETTSAIWVGSVYYTGIKKINITNQSDQITVSYNDTQTYSKPYSVGGGIIINGDRVINGTTGYTCGNAYFTDNGAQNPYVAFWSIHNPYAISSVVTPNAMARTATQPRYILANKMVNTTLFNLDSVAQKLSSQRMTIEYTLTETTS